MSESVGTIDSPNVSEAWKLRMSLASEAEKFLASQGSAQAPSVYQSPNMTRQPAAAQPTFLYSQYQTPPPPIQNPPHVFGKAGVASPYSQPNISREQELVWSLQLEELQQNNFNLQHENAELKRQVVEQNTARIRQMSKQTELLKQEKEAIESLNTRLQKDVRRLRKEKDELTKCVENTDLSKDEAVQSLNARLEDESAERLVAEKRLEESLEGALGLSRKLETLQDENDSLTGRLGEAENRIETLEEEHVGLKKSLLTAEGREKAAESSKKNVESSLSKQITGEQDRVRMLSEALQHSEASLNEIRAISSELRSQLIVKDTANSELETQVKASRAELERLAGLLHDESSARSEIEEKMVRYLEVQETLDITKAKLDDETVERMLLKDKFEEAETQHSAILKELTAQIEALESIIKDLRTEVKLKSDRHEDAMNQVSKLLDGEISERFKIQDLLDRSEAALQEERSSAHELAAAFESREAALQASIDTYELEAKALREAREEAEEIRGEVKQDLDERRDFFDQVMEAMKNRVSDAEDVIAQQNALIESQSGTIAQQAGRIDSLSVDGGRIADINERSAARMMEGDQAVEQMTAKIEALETALSIAAESKINAEAEKEKAENSHELTKLKLKEADRQILELLGGQAPAETPPQFAPEPTVEEEEAPSTPVTPTPASASPITPNRSSQDIQRRDSVSSLQSSTDDLKHDVIEAKEREKRLKEELKRAQKETKEVETLAKKAQKDDKKRLKERRRNSVAY